MAQKKARTPRERGFVVTLHLRSSMPAKSTQPMIPIANHTAAVGSDADFANRPICRVLR